MRVLIVGAGISGLSMALALEKVGIYPQIIEKNSILSQDGAGIALPLNAVRSLSYLGLKNKLMSFACIAKNITYALPNGEVLSNKSLLQSPLGQYPFVGIHRMDLINLLANAINSKIMFNKHIVDINFINEKNNAFAKVKFNDGKIDVFDLVIAADGINSNLRLNLTKSELREDLGISNWRFVSNFKLQNPIYYFGKKSAFMIYPINNEKVYCYAHISDTQNKCRAGKDYLSTIFGDHPEQVTWLIKSVAQENIIFGRLTSLSKPIFSHGNVAFIGDASHACSPMLQQGAASSLEDAITLARMLQKFNSIERTLIHYKEIRQPRIEWIKENSDSSIKEISACITDAEYEKRNELIKKNGPVNIAKWKALFAEDYIDSLENYLIKADHLN